MLVRSRCRVWLMLGFSAAVLSLASSCSQSSSGALDRSETQASPKGGPADDQLPPGKLNSEPETVQNVESAVRRAVGWHPRILKAAGRIKQQEEAITDARSGYLPSIGGGVNLGSATGTQSDRWSPVLSVSASQMIYDFGKVSGRVQAETSIRDVRRAEFLTVVDDIIRETVLASVEIMRNADLAAVAREQVSDTKAIAFLVTSRTDRGASTRSDKLQAEARVQAAQATGIESWDKGAAGRPLLLPWWRAHLDREQPFGFQPGSQAPAAAMILIGHRFQKLLLQKQRLERQLLALA